MAPVIAYDYAPKMLEPIEASLNAIAQPICFGVVRHQLGLEQRRVPVDLPRLLIPTRSELLRTNDFIRRVVVSDGWVAVGAAAMAFDLLCGPGVAEA